MWQFKPADFFVWIECTELVLGKTSVYLVLYCIELYSNKLGKFRGVQKKDPTALPTLTS